MAIGKTNSSGKSTSDATAAATDILSGKTAYVNNNKITGTIASINAQTIIPSTVSQTLQAGRYLAGDQVIAGAADLIAANIKKDISLFGIVGTLSPDPTAVVYNGYSYQYDTVAICSVNLPKLPKIMVCLLQNNSEVWDKAAVWVNGTNYGTANVYFDTPTTTLLRCNYPYSYIKNYIIAYAY